MPLVKSDWVQSWMTTLAKLPAVDARTIQVGDQKIVADEALFYTTRYGTPLAYARALDIACEHEQFAAAGFEVLRFDTQDDDMARTFGRALGWDADMELEKDLFAWYTIVTRKKIVFGRS